MLLPKSFKRYYDWIFKNNFRRRIFKIFLGATIWCIIVLPTFFAYSKEGERGGSYLEVQSQNNLPKDYLSLQMDLLNIDPLSKKADFLVQIDPIGAWSNSNKTIKNDIDVNLRYKRKTFQRGTAIEPFTFSVTFVVGNLRDYPFEKFVSIFPIEISTKRMNETGGMESVLVPTKTAFYGISQLFRIRFNEVSDEGKVDEFFSTFTTFSSSKIYTVVISRPPTTLLVCAFMVILMWFLALALTNIAAETLLNNREIPPPILGTSVAMLFALPALRNTQPGIPAMGCKSDILGFFWSLVLIAISAVTLLFKWSFNLKSEIKKNGKQPSKPDQTNFNNHTNIANKDNFEYFGKDTNLSTINETNYNSSLSQPLSFDVTTSIDSNLSFRGKNQTP